MLPWIELRCKKCGRLLLKGVILGEIKCPKCGYVNKVDKIGPLVLKGVCYEHELWLTGRKQQ